MSEIEEREKQIASIARFANSDCNTSKEATYKYRASRENVARYYLMPKPVWHEPLGGLAQCEGLLGISEEVYLPNPKRLVYENEYRRDFVYRQRVDLANDKALLALMKDLVSSGTRDDEELLGIIEERHSNVGKSIWDCIRLLFSGGRR